MDDKTLRLQCLQQSNQLLGTYNMNNPEKHTSEEVLNLAEKLFNWITTGNRA
jgi:hypothetical protein